MPIPIQPVFMKFLLARTILFFFISKIKNSNNSIIDSENATQDTDLLLFDPKMDKLNPRKPLIYYKALNLSITLYNALYIEFKAFLESEIQKYSINEETDTDATLEKCINEAISSRNIFILKFNFLEQKIRIEMLNEIVEYNLKQKEIEETVKIIENKREVLQKLDDKFKSNLTKFEEKGIINLYGRLYPF